MKFTIFLCSAFIVLVACFTERDDPDLWAIIKHRCLLSIIDAQSELLLNSSAYNSSDITKTKKVSELYEQAKYQFAYILRAVQEATIKDMSVPLRMTPDGVYIECSKELAFEVMEIVSKYYAAVKALDAENQTTTPQPTDE